MKRIDKDFSEIEDFSKVDLKSHKWSWGRGGFPFGDDEHFISYLSLEEGVSEDFEVEIRYKLPDFINHLLKAQYQSGCKEAQDNIKRALGIH